MKCAQEQVQALSNNILLLEKFQNGCIICTIMHCTRRDSAVLECRGNSHNSKCDIIQTNNRLTTIEITTKTHNKQFNQLNNNIIVQMKKINVTGCLFDELHQWYSLQWVYFQTLAWTVLGQPFLADFGTPLPVCLVAEGLAYSQWVASDSLLMA